MLEFQNELWLFGGYSKEYDYGGEVPDEYFFNDVWNSSDGVNWIPGSNPLGIKNIIAAESKGQDIFLFCQYSRISDYSSSISRIYRTNQFFTLLKEYACNYSIYDTFTYQSKVWFDNNNLNYFLQ